jgi:MFS family permease
MSIPVAGTDQATTQESRRSSLRYAWYVVFVLMICYTISFIDRQILSLLVAPIKRDLGISDTKIGLLQGLAFALFYTLLGFPLGWIADRYSRRNLIAAGVFFWSLMTALCSIATSFSSLFFARMGVGVGEATLGPSAFSLISDYFPKERLGGALSVYSMGIFIGSGLALIVGGTVVGAVQEMPAVTMPVIGVMASWRLTFLIVGIPGLIIGLLAYTIREPLRRNLLRNSDGMVMQLNIRDVVSQLLFRWESVVGVSLALSAQAMCNYAMLAWSPTFFQRIHNWSPGKTGLILGSMILTVGIIGMYFGGRLCDHWMDRRIKEAPLKVGVLSTVCAGLFFGLSMNMPSLPLLLTFMVPAQFFLAMPVGSSYAALQLIFPNQMRGQVSALLIFTINIGGLVLGPFLPGFFNDYMFDDENMVGYSLTLTVVMASLVSAVLFRSTYRPYRRHYAQMQEIVV